MKVPMGMLQIPISYVTGFGVGFQYLSVGSFLGGIGGGLCGTGSHHSRILLFTKKFNSNINAKNSLWMEIFMNANQGLRSIIKNSKFFFQFLKKKR
jgi:hypothetical protein